MSRKHSTRTIYHCVHSHPYEFDVAPYGTMEMLVVPLSIAQETAFNIICSCSKGTCDPYRYSCAVHMVIRVGYRIMVHS